MAGSHSIVAAPTALLLIGAAGAGYFSDDLSAAVKPGHAQHFVTRTAPDCDIKGNISMNTGERIYHVPGQKYYASTIVNTAKGERWFCSEAKARAAGWRRSRV